MTRFAFLLTASILAAPLPGRVGAQMNNCLPPKQGAAPVANLDGLRGSTLLIAYGTAGPRKGRITSGTLDLEPASEAMRRAGVVLVGSTTIDLARIGGQYTGSLRSRDPATPAVTVEAARDGHPATMTLGSVRVRNARGEVTSAVTRFELIEKSIKGFRGYWHTRNGTGAPASGYFCASPF